MSWQFDMTAAPLGETVAVTETYQGKERTRQEHRHERVWLWTKCGKKLLSKWLPPSKFTPKGRWDGLATTEVPVAWHRFDIPADPVMACGISVFVDETMPPNELRVIGAHETISITIDDCGSGA